MVSTISPIDEKRMMRNFNPFLPLNDDPFANICAAVLLINCEDKVRNELVMGTGLRLHAAKFFTIVRVTQSVLQTNSAELNTSFRIL